jgi:DNA-binding NtrC family response regulator
MATILLVVDEPSVGPGLREMLARAGHAAHAVTSAQEALGALARGDVDLVIADDQMPGVTGLELLQLLQQEGCDAPMLVLTGQATGHPVRFIRSGAIGCLVKPIPSEQLELAVDQALAFVRLRRENEALRREMLAIRPDAAVVLTTLDVGEAEARLIERALVVANGNRTRAAKLLGISVRTLRNKLNGPGRAAAEAAAD